MPVAEVVEDRDADTAVTAGTAPNIEGAEIVVLAVLVVRAGVMDGVLAEEPNVVSGVEDRLTPNTDLVPVVVVDEVVGVDEGAEAADESDALANDPPNIGAALVAVLVPVAGAIVEPKVELPPNTDSGVGLEKFAGVGVDEDDGISGFTTAVVFTSTLASLANVASADEVAVVVTVEDVVEELNAVVVLLPTPLICLVSLVAAKGDTFEVAPKKS